MPTPLREKYHLPPRPFLYTLDQIGTIISETPRGLMESGYLFFFGRQPGAPKPDEIRVINIAPPDKQPDWRVEERELIRWMKRKGFKYVDR